ncbi:MAG: dihydrofolate synthase / folylpolyglutamate synthase [Anaerolineaceae bacterium]|nr:MAG: dihydrofolate synthase / folylpolyglutamate synthase [Anaerolineaceae bacterium]
MPSRMDTELAYNQALDYLYSFVDYSLKKASELAKADFNLDRMRDLMALLGSPEQKYPILHVAGTKGKGSTSALMAAALTAAGYRTGLYTSPHLQDYCERIQIDGENVSHVQLVQLVEQVKPHVAAVPKLTTFEITTAIGFLYFAQQNVDAAVIEVGLGGRLDATNVVTPRVSVITSLSYDHMAVLGDTLTLIAGEKAGIIKPGIPVVSSPQKDEARLVLEKIAVERGSPLTLVGRDVTFTPGDHSLDGQTLTIVNRKSSIPFGYDVVNPKSVILRIPLLGMHQVENAATAYAALQASGLDVSDEAVREGFAGVKWPCRFEILRSEPPVILDSAHNQDSFAKLRQTLEEYFPGRKVILILGASEDKSLAEMLAEMKPCLRLLVATKADHPRALEPEKIVETADRLGVRAEAAAPVEAALARALDLSAADGSIVLSAGSMFVTAEVKTAWENTVGKLTR